MVDGGVVHVLVTGEDPFADDLSPRDASAQENKDGFEKPEDYDFSMVHFTDTQYLAEGAAGGTYDDWDGVAEPSDVMTAEEQEIWKQGYLKSTEWIRDNAEARKIKYTAHTGDVIENDYYNPLATNASGGLLYPGLNEQVDREFAFTSAPTRSSTTPAWSTRSSPATTTTSSATRRDPTAASAAPSAPTGTTKAATRWPSEQEASFHAWDETTGEDGTVTRGRDSQNNYVLWSAGGLDFVSVGLSYGVTPGRGRVGQLGLPALPRPQRDPADPRLPGAVLGARRAGGNFSVDGSRLYEQVVGEIPTSSWSSRATSTGSAPT